jgi:hypothetical protein
VSGTVQFFYAWNPTVGANHQVNFGVGVGSYVYLFAAFSDVQTISDPFETSSDSTHSGTTIQPGSVTPSATGDLLISSVGSQFGAGFTASIDSGFSLVPSSQTELKLAYLNALSTSPTDPTWTLNTSQSYGANIAVFAHA